MRLDQRGGGAALGAGEGVEHAHVAKGNARVTGQLQDERHRFAARVKSGGLENSHLLGIVVVQTG